MEATYINQACSQSDRASHHSSPTDRPAARRQDDRQAHDELAPLPGAVALGLHPPVVHLDQPAHQAQPDAEPALRLLRRTIALREHVEELGQHLGGDADAILVSSSNGHAEIDAKGMREKCQEAGLENILLYIGGNLVVGQQQREWSEVHDLFKKMKFDRVYPTSVLPQEVVKDLREDLGICET